MIDTKLIGRAKEKSKVIAEIDSSWRRFVASLKENTFVFPFQGEYSSLVKESSVLVEGYCGTLQTDRIYYNHKTYLLKTPVKCCSFKIYGAYSKRGSFERFFSIPEMGFHYLGMSGEAHAICTGYIQYANPDSLVALKEVCLKIISSLRLINLESLGTVILPEEHACLRNILSDKDTDSNTKFEKLVKENLIEEIF